MHVTTEFDPTVSEYKAHFCSGSRRSQFSDLACPHSLPGDGHPIRVFLLSSVLLGILLCGRSSALIRQV